MMPLEILSSKRVPGSVLNSLVTLFTRTKLYVMLTISMSMLNVRVNPKQAGYKPCEGLFVLRMAETGT